MPWKVSFVEGIDGVIRWAVRALALLMTFVVIMGVVEVVWELYDRLRQPPIMKLGITELEATFGTFMAVLVAIAILANITLRLREGVVRAEVVMGTALIATARTVIILDLREYSAPQVWGVAALVLATAIGYWLVRGGSPKSAPLSRESADVPSGRSPAEKN